MTGSEFVKTYENDHIIEVVIDRQAKLNAMTPEMFSEIGKAAHNLSERADLRLLLIRAQGKYFSAGVDISAAFQHRYTEASAARSYGTAIHAVYDQLARLEKPVVIAHQGPCLGGGLEMSLSCDFRLAAESATYGLPELDFGLLPGSGGTSRLTRLVGAHWARWLVMANRQIDAQRALTIGLVHDVFPDDRFEAEVRAFCQDLARQPPEAVSMAKMAIELSAELDIGTGRAIERLANSALFLGTEHRSRMADFMERMFKRKKD